MTRGTVQLVGEIAGRIEEVEEDYFVLIGVPTSAFGLGMLVEQIISFEKLEITELSDTERETYRSLLQRAEKKAKRKELRKQRKQAH